MAALVGADAKEATGSFELGDVLLEGTPINAELAHHLGESGLIIARQVIEHAFRSQSAARFLTTFITRSTLPFGVFIQTQLSWVCPTKVPQTVRKRVEVVASVLAKCRQEVILALFYDFFSSGTQGGLRFDIILGMNNEKDTNNTYHYGFPTGTFDETLDEFTLHGTNSHKTSSIPLVESWRPDYIHIWQHRLEQLLPGIDIKKALKIFEYPTDARHGRLVVSPHPSMTDLMLIDNDWQVAIEAKYTEYSKMEETKCNARPKKLLLTWLKMIRDYGCTDLSDDEFLAVADKVSYQFLHRTASACYKTNGAEGQKPCLIYQLFVDWSDDKSKTDCRRYEEQLRTYARILHLRRMKFLIISCPIINQTWMDNQGPSFYGKDGSHLFQQMHTRTTYEFNWECVEVKEVL